jgi:hypothetical protein
MTGVSVPTWLLEAGNVIHVCHHHDSQCGGCLAHGETDAVVTGQPASVGGRVAIKWASAHLPGARPAVTGINVFEPDEQVLRIGRLPVRTSRPGTAVSPVPPACGTVQGDHRPGAGGRQLRGLP